jgi:ribosomal protein L11 methyltransferase
MKEYLRLKEGEQEIKHYNSQVDEVLKETYGLLIYDEQMIQLANILADILVPMTPAIVPAMKKGGIYITSGILQEYAYKVIDACKAAGLEIKEQTQQGEWVSITAVKP